MTNKDMADVGAVLTAAGVAFEWLPQIAALLAIIWTLIRIYEWARVRLFGKQPDIKL